MKVLITGITGFVGSHLAEQYLNHSNFEIYGIRKWRSDMENVKHIEDKIKWHDCDITDSHSVEEAIKQIEPDRIHHLAAMSFVPSSWQYPQRTVEVNVIGSLNIFEAVRKFVPRCIVQIASSSEIYGIPTKLPITEKMLPNPCSPYGVSKLAMDRFASQYYQSFGTKIIITRGFNHTGPRRGEAFVCSSFAKQVAQIKLGQKEPKIMVGNLNAIRDFLDVRDVCIAYRKAMGFCNYGEPYNVSSQKGIKIQDVLHQLIKLAKLRVEVLNDPNRMRPSDLHTLVGDSSKFREKIEWTPGIPFEKTLEDLLNYWIDKLH